MLGSPAGGRPIVLPYCSENLDLDRWKLPSPNTPKSRRHPENPHGEPNQEAFSIRTQLPASSRTRSAVQTPPRASF